MSNNISEDLPSRADIPASSPRPQKPDAKPGDGNAVGPGGEEKRIRQAVYDIRYRARREEIPLAQAFSQYMQNASLNGVEKLAVRKKLFEEYRIDDMTSDGIAAAMFKVFVEGNNKDETTPAEKYLREFKMSPNVKYKVRVTDNNGTTYVRYADRDKITKLRSNPNIREVEMTGYGEPYEGEKKRGEQTAAALAGKKLDPVGKEDSDINNDRKVNKTDDYLQHRRDVRKTAIDGENTVKKTESKLGDKKMVAAEGLVGNQKNIDVAKPFGKLTGADFKRLRSSKNKLTKEEFLSDDTAPTTSQNEKEIIGKGVNNYKKKGGKSVVTVYPTLSNQTQTEETITEKSVSTAQQKFFGMVHAYKNGKMKNASKAIKKAAASMSDTEATKFASTKHEGLPAHVAKEEVQLDETGMPIIVMKKKRLEKSDPMVTSDLKKINPDDSRGDFAKDLKTKNTLRSMGAKNVMIVDEEKIDEVTRYAKETGKSFRTGKSVIPGGTAKDDKAFQMISKIVGPSRVGATGRGKKKVPGQKPPAAGERGGPISPAQKVQRNRDIVKRGEENMSSRFD